MLPKNLPASKNPVLRFCIVAFALSMNHSSAQIKVDGNLDSREWAMAIKTSRFSFDFGNCYYALQSDTLFFAFDVIADNMDNDPTRNQQTDIVEVYIDVNSDNVRDSQDVIFRANSIQKDGGLTKTCGACELRLNNHSDGIYATVLGISPFYNDYDHRTWELAIPLKALPVKTSAGFGCRITSAYPQFSTLALIDKTDLGYESLLTINNSGVRISRQKNTPHQLSPNNPMPVTSRRILDD